jgi:signal transduction histidine kinase
MGNSFRSRLLTSFILPMFVLIPIIGLVLIYLLEYQVFLPALTKEMTAEGKILALEFQENPATWSNPAAAQTFIDRLSLSDSMQIDLLDGQNRLLATNRPDENPLIGQSYQALPGLNGPPSGPNSVPTINIIVPIEGPQNQAMGRLYLTRRLADVDQGLREARDWIIAALLIGVLMNTVLGLVLSARITRPLRQITQAIPLASLDGEPNRIQSQGLSELDALARAFNQLQERRFQIESTRKQMLANLVHELSRPLGSLQIAAHALLSGAESNASLRLDLLQGMSERIEWLGHLVNDLTQAYLPEHTLELRSLPFNPGPWLETLVPLWIEMARHKGIEWHSSWPDQLPVIDGDPARLEQAVGNLVSNAIKFTPSGGKVSMTVGTETGQFWISVADNGSGISSDDLQHLFDPFFRAERTALKAPGLGLGLSIAKTIAEAHGGSIEVHSHPGEGSQFTLCIPYHAG